MMLVAAAATGATAPGGGGRLSPDWQFREAYPAPLRWVELERRVAHPAVGPDRVSLPPDPQDDWTVRLPADSWLRILDRHHANCGADLQVFRSNGSGLFVEANRLCSLDGHSSLFAEGNGEERVMRIRGKLSGARLFRSDLAAVPAITPYRKPVNLDAPQTRIADPSGGRYRVFRIGSGLAATNTLRGPTQLKIRSRLHYGSACASSADRDPLPAYPDSVDSYRLTLSFDQLPGPGDCFGKACAPTDEHWVMPLDIDTTPEYRRPLTIDGCPAITSRQEVRHVNVPAGRFRMTLSSTASTLLQVMTLGDADFLIPALNSPLTEPRRGSSTDAPQALSQALDQAWSIRTDNTRRAGALGAIEALRAAIPAGIATHPLTREMREVRARHSYWRNLLPTAPETRARQFRAVPLAPRLTPLDAPDWRMYVHRRHLPALEAAVAAAFFTPLPTARDCVQACAAPALRVHLPDRVAPSELQILADLNSIPGPMELWLQFDDETPRRLLLEPRGAEASRGQLPTAAEAALTVLEASSTGNPLFATAWADQIGADLPWLASAHASIELPPTVTRLRVWSGSPGQGSPNIALRYRASTPFRLSDRDYLDALRRLPEGTALQHFTALLGEPSTSGTWYVEVAEHATVEAATAAAQALRQQGLSIRTVEIQRPDAGRAWRIEAGPFASPELARAGVQAIPGASTTWSLRPDNGPGSAVELAKHSPADPARARLAQHWLPGLRMLHDRLRRYRAPVGPLPAAARSTEDPAASLAAAQQALEHGDMPAVLEHVAPARAWPDTKSRLQALSLRLTALRSANESFLAERQLRALALHDHSTAVRDWATQELLDAYTDADQRHNRQALLLARMLDDPKDPARWAGRLAGDLALDGETDAAFDLAFCLPPARRPHDILVPAAIQDGRGSLLENLLGELPPQQRGIWRGYHHLKAGDLQAARDEWRRVEARPALEHLDRGLATAGRLVADSASTRLQAVTDWRAWTNATPGPWIWRERWDLVSAHAGYTLARIHSRDLLVSAYRATSAQPARLEMEGPAILRLELRPLMDTEAETDGWISLSIDGTAHRLPAWEIRPAAGWVGLANAPAGIGRAVVSHLELGPGHHTVELSADTFPLMFKVATWEPLLSLPILPRLSPSHLQRAIRGDWSLDLPHAGAPGPRSRLRLLSGGAVSPTTAPLSRKPADSAPLPQSPVAPRHRNSPVAVRPPPLPQPREALLNAVWAADQNPADRSAHIRAAGYALEYPELPESAAVLRRLSRRARWQTVLGSPVGGSVLRWPAPGWQPVEPGMQIRKALLGLDAPDVRVLRPGDGLRTRLRRLHDDQLRLRLHLHELPGIAAAPAQIRIRLNDSAARHIRLGPNHRQASVTLPLSASDHILNLAFEAGFAGQIVAVTLADDSGPIPAQEVREYLVADRANPIEFQVQGPALLAVSRMSGQPPQTRYLTVLEKQGRLLLTPPPGSERSVFRVRSLTLDPTETNPSMIRQSELRLPEPADTLPTSSSPARLLRLDERINRERQSAGTWSASAGWRRLGADEDSGQRLGSREYFQTGIRYRRASASDQWHLDAGAGLRRHRVGPASHGLELGLDHQTDNSPWRARLAASVFTQMLDRRRWGGRMSLSGSRPWHWSTTWSSRLNLSLQQRLSERPPPDKQLRPDPAVISDYASNHPRTLQLEGSQDFTPRLDTRLRLGLSLRSNDPLRELSLDQWRARLKLSQLVGAWDASARIQWRELQADNDRSRTQVRRTFELGLAYDQWQTRNSRWAFGVVAGLEPDLDSHSIRLTLEYSLANARLYRDFDAGEIPFRDLRTLRSLRHIANDRIKDACHVP